MARRPLLVLAVAAALAAVAVPGALLARLATAEVALQAVPPPEGLFQTVVAPQGRSGRMELLVGPFPRVEGARYALRVLIGLNRPTSTIELDLRDARGETLAACSFGRGSYVVERYSQTALLACPLPDSAAARTVVVSADAPDSAVAIWARRRDDGRFVAGRLLADQPRGVSAAFGRLELARPPAFRAPTIMTALALSIALLGAAALALARQGEWAGGDEGSPPHV